MKRKILAAALAAAMMTVLSACTGGNESGADNGTIPSPETSQADITEEISQETETEAESETESNTETESRTESETETQTERQDDNENINDDVFKGSGYTLTVDSDKWIDFTEYIDMVAKFAGDSDLDIDINEEDILGMSDALFYYTDDYTTNANIVVNEIGDLGSDVDLSIFAAVVENQYKSMDGFTYRGSETVDVNGKSCLKIDVLGSKEIFGADEDMRMTQYMFLNGADQYIVTFTSYLSSYDAAFADFEKMLNSISFDSVNGENQQI
ncbi:MAG: hypothetical protein NC120_00450 [Ruminococcus sp.]|nr:hypothetical protein [Ruminococcus sp.]